MTEKKTGSGKGTVTAIKCKEEFYQLIQGPQLTIVDFYTDWCGPCKVFAPKFVDMARKNETVRFAKVDCTEGKLDSLGDDQKVTQYPTLLFYRNGRQVEKQVGADRNKIQSFIDATE